MSKTRWRTRLHFAWLVLLDRGVAYNLVIGKRDIGSNKPGKWNTHNITGRPNVYDLMEIGRDKYVWELGAFNSGEPNPFDDLKYGDKNPYPGRYSGNVFIREEE